MLVRAFSFVWLVIAGIGITTYLSTSGVGVWVLGVGGAIGAAALYRSIRERNRRNKEGYYVYKRGGAEGGILFYSDQGRELQFYFDRRTDTIYIPADPEWKQIMPTWAHDHKPQIVSRIKQRIGKRLIGKSWNYEETGDLKQIVPKERQGHSTTTSER